LAGKADERSVAKPLLANNAKAATQGARSAYFRRTDAKDSENTVKAALPSHDKGASCHRSERTAPGARTARRMDDGSGRSPDSRVDALFPPSRAECCPVAFGRELSAYSCGRSCGFGRRLKASPHSHLAGPSTNEPERGYNRGDIGYVNAAGRVPYLESLRMLSRSTRRTADSDPVTSALGSKAPF
jgi:hypothetical protein